MGSNGDQIVIESELDSKGFVRGTQEMAKAIDSLNNTITEALENIKRLIDSVDFGKVADGLKNNDMSKVVEEFADAMERAREEAKESNQDGGIFGGEDGFLSLQNITGAIQAVVSNVGKIATVVKTVAKTVRNVLTSAFQAVSKAAKTALNVVSKGINGVKKAASGLSKLFGSSNKSVSSLLGTFKRIIPLLIGVRGVYQALSKAVNAYMSENEKLQQRMSAIWTALGNVIGPIIERIIDWVSTAVSYFLEFLRLLGITNKTASELSKKANKSANELKKTISGFDELNILQDNNNKENPLEDKEPSEWMKELSELLKNKMWDEAADLIVDKINNIIKTIREKANELGQVIGEYLGGALHILARIVRDVNWEELGQAVAEFVNGLIKKIMEIDPEALGTLLVAKFAIMIRLIKGFFLGIKPDEVMNFFVSTFIGALNTLRDAIGDPNTWREIGNKIGEGFQTLLSRKDEIGEAISGLFEGAWNAAMGLLGGFFDRVGPEDLATLLTDAVTGALGLLTKLFEDETQAEKIGAGIRTFFENINWKEIEEALGRLLKEAWDFAWGILIGYLKGDPNTDTDDLPIVKQFEEMKKNLEDIATNGMKVVQDFSKLIGDIVGTNLPSWLDGVNTVLKLINLILEAIHALMDNGLFDDKGKLMLSMSYDEYGDITEQLEEIQRQAEATKEPVSELNNELSEAGRAMEDVASGAEAASSKLQGVNADAEATDEALRRVSEHSQSTRQGLEEAAQAAQEASSAHRDAKNELESFTAAAEELGPAVDNAATATGELTQKAEGISSAASAMNDVSEAAQDATSSISGLDDAAEPTAKTLEDMSASAKEASENAKKTAKEWDEMSKSVSESLDEMEKNVDEAYSNIADTIKGKMDDIKNNMETVMRSINDTVTKTVNDMEKNVQNIYNRISSLVKSRMSEIQNNVATALTSMNQQTQSAMMSISGVVQSSLSSLASYSYIWGVDLMANFVNGIYSMSGYLESACYYMASVVQAYLGFSEPEKGPLSKFHTFGPDMMKLYSEGILGEKGVVISAVNDVAEAVSDGLTGDLRMPTVASGNFLPYNVGGDTGMFSGGGEDAFISRLSGAIYDAVASALSDMGGASGVRTAILNVNGREFCRATFYDQQTVAREHGVSLITNG